ncbi:uncharacterized protein Hap1MRO34_008120 isoform 1-T2 [Clarias gariepinus]
MMNAAGFLAVIALVTTGAGAGDNEVITEPSVNAKHGEKVTLTCSIKENAEVLTLQWIFGQELLCYFTKMERVVPHNFQCNYTDKNTLVLTIKPAKSGNNGNYTCKYRSQIGHGKSVTKLHVSEEQMVISETYKEIKQDRNQACISEGKWINLLGSLTVLLVLTL